MSRVPAVFLSLMFLVAFTCCAIPARADPIRVTSGLVDAGFGPLGGPWNGEALELTGAVSGRGGDLRSRQHEGADRESQPAHPDAPVADSPVTTRPRSRRKSPLVETRRRRDLVLPFSERYRRTGD
jgi:hypothetical protein